MGRAVVLPAVEKVFAFVGDRVTSLRTAGRCENLLSVDFPKVHAISVSEQHSIADLLVDGRIVD